MSSSFYGGASKGLFGGFSKAAGGGGGGAFLTAYYFRATAGTPSPLPTGAPPSPSYITPADTYPTSRGGANIGFSGTPTGHDTFGGDNMGYILHDFDGGHMVRHSASGAVKLHLGFGLSFGGPTTMGFVVYDGAYGSTILHTQAGVAVPNTHRMDANGNLHTLANFHANETGLLINPTGAYFSILGSPDAFMNFLGTKAP